MVQRRTIVRSIIQLAFCSQERIAITAAAQTRRDAVVHRITTVRKRNDFWMYLELYKVFAQTGAATRPPATHVDANVVDYICECMGVLEAESNRRGLPLRRGEQGMTLGLLQMMDDGFAPHGATVLQPVPYITTHGLSPIQYGKLSSVRCRTQTIAVRQMQRVVVSITGNAVMQLPQFHPHAGTR